MEVLNKAKASALFQQEACLIGNQDMIFEGRAVELFGEKAVDYAHETGTPGADWNVWYPNLRFLTYKGLLKAVSYHNAEQIGAREKKKADLMPPCQSGRAEVRA